MAICPNDLDFYSFDAVILQYFNSISPIISITIMKFIIAIVFLVVGLGMGWSLGRQYNDFRIYEKGYNLGFQDAMVPGTVIDISTGKKYKIVEEK